MTPSEDDLDLASRELCPDDACIGVLGPDGICPECGRGRDGSRAAAEAAASSSASADADGAGGDEGGAFDEDRELCPDDACIGLIGADGQCRECGRTRQS